MHGLNKHKSQKEEIKELWLITCVAQLLAEYDWANDFLTTQRTTDYIYTFDLIKDLADCIDIAAILYYISHNIGVSQAENKATKAVKKIRQIWKDNDGCWPEKYRFDIPYECRTKVK